MKSDLSPALPKWKGSLLRKDLASPLWGRRERGLLSALIPPILVRHLEESNDYYVVARRCFPVGAISRFKRGLLTLRARCRKVRSQRHTGEGQCVAGAPHGSDIAVPNARRIGCVAAVGRMCDHREWAYKGKGAYARSQDSSPILGRTGGGLVLHPLITRALASSTSALTRLHQSG